jgi:hypothetical protein
MMRNMRCVNAEAMASIDSAAIGVFAFMGKDGRPRACAVTPYLHAAEAVVSSTLAFTAKVAAVRRDPRTALLAGGYQARGRATVEIDLTSATFDARLRAQELRKYPPARQLLAIPGHRRLLWWYVGRALITIPLSDCTPAEGIDRITLTVLDGDLPTIVTLDPATDTSREEIAVPAGLDGPACLLVHDEDARMTDLRQLALHGTVRGRRFSVDRRAGSLAPANPAAAQQLKMLRDLARQARTKRAVFERWAHPADPAGR